jgi:hypothetical protein
MLKYLMDENVNPVYINQLRRRKPDLIIRAIGLVVKNRRYAIALQCSVKLHWRIELMLFLTAAEKFVYPVSNSSRSSNYGSTSDRTSPNNSRISLLSKSLRY